MKVTLIFPNYLESFFIIPASFHPPLGLAMIAAVLKVEGHDVQVIDATAERMNVHRLLKRLKKIQPDILGITANIAFARKAFITGKWLKKHLDDIPIIYGGPWPSTEPDYILRGDAGDYVVIGEGEITIVELLKAIERGTDLSEVKGLAYRRDGDIIQNPPRPHIEDLDNLPMPAWELFPSPKHYFFDSKFKRFYPVMTSRGCPMGCVHCTKLVHGYKIRTKSVPRVIEEIVYLHDRFRADNILIIDDNFNYFIDRAVKICQEISKLDFKMGLHFSNGIRADKLTLRLAMELKRAGAYDIALGIESGNQEIVYKIGKNLKLDAVRRAVQILKTVGIFTTGFIMLGLPNETLSTLIDTKQFLMELNLDEAHIFKVIPFPGTRLHDIFQKKGYLLQEDLVKHVNFYISKSAPLYRMDGMPPSLIDLAYEDIYKTFYMRLRKILAYVRHIRIRSWKWYLNFGLYVIRNVLRQGVQNTASEKGEIIRQLLAYKSTE
ncbi:radical SAM protein [Candidatus Bathyarchaeota archaeon]|nr:radical SAM protein [Candidatus Bathyarchaeota archaeon]